MILGLFVRTLDGREPIGTLRSVLYTRVAVFWYHDDTDHNSEDCRTPLHLDEHNEALEPTTTAARFRHSKRRTKEGRPRPEFLRYNY